MSTLTFEHTFIIREVFGSLWIPSPTNGPMVFTSPSAFDNTSSITIDFARKKVIVHMPGYEVGDEFMAWLEAAEKTYANDYPDHVSGKIYEIKQETLNLARRIMEHAKYFLGLDEIADDVVIETQAIVWRCSDSDEYRKFPGLMNGSMSAKNRMALNEQTRNLLQEGLDKGYKPFLAMRHLYRAMQETAPRFKWIDATIAAELAIKEFLARSKPELEVLLVHLPSPPLTKLYGEVLLKCAGVKSPYLKELDKGSRMRNTLVHQAEVVKVTEAEAIEYVNTVMKAIHHLYTLLYPDWEIANSLQAFERLGM